MFMRRMLIGAGSVAVAGMIALMLFVTGSGAASAQGGTSGASSAAGSIARATGKIGTISGTGFTLATPKNGTVQVTTDDKTWFVTGKGSTRASGSLADFAAGADVAVSGTRNADGSIAARVVAAGGGRVAAVAGRKAKAAKRVAQISATVKSINGTTLTVTGPKGAKEATVNTDAATIFLKGGFVGLDAIKVGDTVHIVPRAAARGAKPAPGTTRTVTAEAVIALGTDETVLLGRVESSDGSKLTMRSQHGQVTVNIDANTTYKALAAAGQAPTAASAADVKQGSLVLVYGAKVSGQDKTFSGKAVVVLPAAGKGKTF